MKKFLFFIAALFVLGIFVIYGQYSSAIRYARDPESNDRVVLTVREGETAAQIAEKLHKEALISSPIAFRAYLRQHDLAGQLKAGQVIVQENFTMSMIIDALVKGNTEEIAVTLLEGWTAEQIAQRLEELGLTTQDDFMSCVKECDFKYEFLPNEGLEGYLYPDTYFVNPDSYSDHQFISRLLATFQQRLSEEDWAAVQASPYSLHQIVTMASIVEKEERSRSARPTVAGILWKRYDEGIGLGADATVLYALGRTSGGLSYQDLQVDSPYNTRKYAGLPPGPISNPSLSSIRAALYPTKSDYYYYLHDSDGVIHYGRTLREHNLNKQKYL
jgi:UPF0755 protein